MEQVDTAITSIKSNGNKITKVRKAILQIVFGSQKPLSALDILKDLSDKNIQVNKTTVYREIAFLHGERLICEVNITARTKHFEASHLRHHHHLVCRNCGSIDEIVSKELESSLERITKQISERFLVKEHNLEFFGVCSNCK